MSLFIPDPYSISYAGEKDRGADCRPGYGIHHERVPGSWSPESPGEALSPRKPAVEAKRHFPGMTI
ncbi:MAG: hypothetical protein WC382_03860 [Methanoregulaceae archaeon]